MPETFFITTAIDYTNAAPHLGHAYEKILGDVLARYHRLNGEPTFFLTGVDQHGQKVQQAAVREGIPPEQFVARTTAKFIALWEKLGISYDRWAATTEPLHQRCVQGILQSLYDAGEIYKAPYKGFYSERQEQFLTDKDRGPDGEFGPEWGEVKEIEEENWYFRLAKHRNWLLAFIDRTPGLVTPAFRQVELRNAVEKISGDLSISRPKSRLAWGIEIPFDPTCVTYVWFDALVNYISFAGYDPKGERANAASPATDNRQSPIGNQQFHSLWPALHVIGKDIIIPAHGIYWMAMLHAIGFTDAEMPSFLVHGYILVDGEKMSKSLGNTTDPHAFADRFGVEALRYYLMRECVVGQDMEFTDERLVQRYNSDLANSLGNLLNRTLSMAQKYRQSRLSRPPEPLGPPTALAVAAYKDAMDEHRIHAGLESALNLAVACNQFIETEQPWKLAKDSATAARLDAVLYELADTLRIIAILLSPVLPRAAEKIFAQLNWTHPFALTDAEWGRLPDGHVLGNPIPVFPRLENTPDAEPA